MIRRIMATLAVLAMIVYIAGAQAMDSNAAKADDTDGMMDMNSAMTPVEHLTPAVNALYPVGSRVLIDTDHMDGMQGAVGIVTGTFDTTLYAVDYISDSGEAVMNHRWVIAEEIGGGKDKAYVVGDTVTLGFGHMGGHGGAGMSAVITSVVNGPAYMVDYDPTDGSDRVVNHQWMAEFELLPVS